LLKADDNILFFVGPDGRLLIGNAEFSYLKSASRRMMEHRLGATQLFLRSRQGYRRG
jgi:hypothetical protein